MSTSTSSPVPSTVVSSNGSPTGSVGMPRPGGRRRRRPALIGLAILLIVGSAAVAGLLALRIDTRVPALVAARPIAVGQQITKDDLAEERIAGDGLTVLGADQAGRVVGGYASQDIPKGRLIDGDMIQTQGFLKDGTVAVGVSIPAGHMPANGLRPGDRVQVVQVVDGQATVLVEEAIVSSVPSSAGSSSGIIGGPASAGDSANGTAATLITTPADAPKVAAASAANRISLILLSRGESLAGQ